MIGMFFFMLGMFGVLTVFVLVVAFSSGALAFPGTSKHRVMLAKNKAKIAEFESETAEMQFRAAQTKVNREQMLELHYTKMDQIQKDRLALGRGDEE